MQCHSSKRNVVPVLYIACFFFYRFMKSTAPVIDRATFAFFNWRDADCIAVGYLQAQGNHALHRMNQASGQRGITSLNFKSCT